MDTNQRQRIIGSGFDTNAVPNVNAFRTKEIMDEDNFYNRQVFEMTKKKIISMSANQDENSSRPTTIVSEQDKYLLDIHINRFINEIDQELEGYYNNVDKTNTGKLLNYWNTLCIFYKANISTIYKTHLDSLLQGEPLSKVNIIRKLAEESNYTDSNEVSQLYNDMANSNYEPIRHILYSSEERPELKEFTVEPVFSNEKKKTQYIPTIWADDIADLLRNDLEEMGEDEDNIIKYTNIDSIYKLIEDTNKNPKDVVFLTNELNKAPLFYKKSTGAKQKIGERMNITKYEPRKERVLTPYEETLLPPTDARHRQVIRTRKIPLGRPTKAPQSEKVSVSEMATSPKKGKKGKN